jgi:hypothetical protein
MLHESTLIESFAAASIDRTALDTLRAALPGRVLTPEDAGYAAAASTIHKKGIRKGFTLPCVPL